MDKGSDVRFTRCRVQIYGYWVAEQIAREDNGATARFIIAVAAIGRHVRLATGHWSLLGGQLDRHLERGRATK